MDVITGEEYGPAGRSQEDSLHPAPRRSVGGGGGSVTTWHTIREASVLTGLPESTLRYYESIGIIPPVARDPSSGHRSYDDQDIDLLMTISCLSATGMSLDDMREYLANRSQGPRKADRQIELLRAQGDRLDRQMELLRIRRAYVSVKIEYWSRVGGHDQAGAKEVLDQGADIIQAARRSAGARQVRPEKRARSMAIKEEAA